MRQLSNEIEVLRKNLVRLGVEKGTKHPDVLKLSQQLDQLIVRYHIEKKSSDGETFTSVSWHSDLLLRWGESHLPKFDCQAKNGLVHCDLPS